MKKWALTGFAFLFLSACSAEEKSLPADIGTENQSGEREVEAEEQETENRQVKEEVPEPGEKKLTETEPLTGKKTEEVSPYRPVAVMINNHPKARPQSGIGQADIVYEVLTEGDMTRLLAIFQSEQPEEVGPVRSARDYFIDLAAGYDAMYVFHGWSPDAKQILQSGTSAFLNGLFHDGTLFQRVDHRHAPHNSYITYGHILEGLEKKGYETEREVKPNEFSDTISKSYEGRDGQEIDIQYGKRYSVHFEYSQTQQTYERFSDGEPSMDERTQEQVTSENVLVIEAAHQIIDSQGRRSINLRDGGEGILFQRGSALPVDWKNKNGRIVPEKNGKEVAFVPGSTWINVVPSLDGIINDTTGQE